MKRLLYIILLAFLLTACGKAETNNKKEQVETKQTEESSDNQVDNTESSEEKDEDSQSTVDVPIVQEPSNQAESNENQSSKNESTGNSNTTTKPSNGSSNSTTTKPSTGNSGSTNNSGSDNSGSSNNSSSNNTGTTTQPVHEHKWTEIVEEEIHYYAWRTLCGKCGTDMTDMTDDEAVYHSAIVCNSRYSTKYNEVNFVTENIVKTPVVTGYRCECGAEKK